MKIIIKINLILFFSVFLLSCNNSKEKEMMKKVQRIQVGFTKSKVDSILKTKPKKFIENTNKHGLYYFEAYYELGHPFGYLFNVSFTKKDTLVISSNW